MQDKMDDGMQIQNLSWNSTSARSNHELLPRNIRGLIVGKSGCGKTTLLLNLLLNPGWLDYDKLFVFSKSLFQPEYKVLRHAMESKLPKELIQWLFQNQRKVQDSGLNITEFIECAAGQLKNKSPIDCYFFENSSQVPDPRELNPCDKNLIVFDDLLLEKQSECEKYYARGRHSNVDCFYLSQNYFKLPRQTIRENANFICLFRQDLKNTNNIFADHASSDLSTDEFRDMCKNIWTLPHNFLVIDLTREKDMGKYRKRFDEFYLPK